MIGTVTTTAAAAMLPVCWVNEDSPVKKASAAGTVAVTEVVVALPELLALDWVEPGEPSPEAAERFGRELAGMHRAGASAFGADWPGFIVPFMHEVFTSRAQRT